jgi:hypothetical protein
MKIGYGMISWECYENKWFYMKYIRKYLSGEILLTRECSSPNWYAKQRCVHSLGFSRVGLWYVSLFTLQHKNNKFISLRVSNYSKDERPCLFSYINWHPKHRFSFERVGQWYVSWFTLQGYYIYGILYCFDIMLNRVPDEGYSINMLCIRFYGTIEHRRKILSRF